MKHNDVTVVIPTKNADKTLSTLITCLKNQQPPVKAIMIIDSGSLDETVLIAEREGIGVVKIEPESFDHGATRNLAADHVETKLIVFMTQDALPADQHTIQQLTAFLEEDKIIAAYARQVPKTNADPLEKYLRFFNYPAHSMVKDINSVNEMGIRAFQCSNVCAAYRCKEFKQLGRFREPAVCNEDMLFVAKAIFSGYAVAYVAEAVVQHSHDYSCLDLFKRYFDIGASLANEKEILGLGRPGESGRLFIKGQIKYLKDQNQLIFLPRVFFQAVAKYSGFTCGIRHKKLPTGLKKYAGLNRLYWEKHK